jgi:UMF1 family MFS transporter
LTTVSPIATASTLTRPVTRAGIAGWVLFDCATQPFFTLVTTFVFAPYFVSKVAATPADGQALWGYATAAAGLVIALTAALLGSIADVAGRRKPWIALFGAMMMAGSAALWMVVPGSSVAIPLALVAFAMATIGAEYATVFNNAMMPSLVPQDRLGRLSGTGWAAGYAAGLVSLLLTLGFLAADPSTGQTLLGRTPLLGLDPSTFEGDRISGPLAAVWFAAFVTPMFLFTPDGRGGVPLGRAARDGLARFRQTLREVRQHRNAALFLGANMIYLDGLIALFAFGGVYAAGVFGWSTTEVGIFGILLTITGTIGALAGGRLDDRIGGKPVILGCLVILAVSAASIASLDSDTVFLVFDAPPALPGDGLFASWPERALLALGGLIGLAAGPVQASARALLCRLAPPDRTTQFFGLFALTGKITSFMGPLLVGLVTDFTGSQRAGVLPLVAFFIVGGVILSFVRVSAGTGQVSAGSAASR